MGRSPETRSRCNQCSMRQQLCVDSEMSQIYTEFCDYLHNKVITLESKAMTLVMFVISLIKE